MTTEGFAAVVDADTAIIVAADAAVVVAADAAVVVDDAAVQTGCAVDGEVSDSPADVYVDDTVNDFDVITEADAAGTITVANAAVNGDGGGGVDDGGSAFGTVDVEVAGTSQQVFNGTEARVTST